MNVLVVDDQPVNQLILEELLDVLGVRASLAADGAEAVAACQAARYDLVLMDVEMPVMDGREATRAIRSGEGGRRTAIVGLTAHRLEEEVERCRAAGMDDVLFKPVGLDDLKGVLAQYSGAQDVKTCPES